MDKHELQLVHGDGGDGATLTRERIVLYAAMIGGVIVAGLAFAYKVAEFIFTMSSNAGKGFADVPVTVYFFVAAGWLALLVWCFVSGKFNNHAEAKFEMLAQEEVYERCGE